MCVVGVAHSQAKKEGRKAEIIAEVSGYLSHC